MATVRERVLALSVVVAFAWGLLAGIPTATASESSEFVSLINQSRSAAGLNSLQTHGDLAAFARNHTSKMIAEGKIFHSSNLGSATSGWEALGENVGMGPNPSLLHEAFMNSSGHRANILGNYTHVGVGAERAPDGTLFVTVVFMRAIASSPTTTTTLPPTTTTTAPPATPPPTTAPPKEAAPSEAKPAPVTAQKAPEKVQTKQVTAPAAPVAPPEVEWKALPVLELQRILGLVPGTFCLDEVLVAPICMD